eukprot:889995_1
MCEALELQKKELKEVSDQLKAIDEGNREKMALFGTLTEQVKALRRRKHASHARISEYKSQIDRGRSQIENAEKRIEEAKRQSSRDHDEEEKEFKEAMDGKFANLVEAKNRLNDLKEKFRQIQDDSEISRQLSDLVRQLGDERAQLQHTLTRLGELKESRRNAVNRFGSRTSEILREIDRNQARFHVKPIGPIGLHIKVEDREWLKAVEACLSPSILCGYVCEDFHDQRIMSEIFARHCHGAVRTPYIVVQNSGGSRYSVHANAFEEYGIKRVWDAISVDNDWVANVLIDQVNPDLFLLMESAGGDGRPGGAYEFLKQIRGHSLQRRQRGVFTKACDKVEDRGGRSLACTNKSRDRTFLEVDVRDEIKILELKENESRERIDVHERHQKVFQARQMELIDLRRSARQNITAANTEVTQVEEEIRDLEDQHNGDTTESGDIIIDIRQEISRYQNDISQHESALSDQNETFDSETAQYKEKQKELNEYKQSCSGEQERSGDLCASLESILEKHAKYAKRTRNMNSKLEELGHEINVDKRHLTALNEKLDQRHSAAVEVHPEPLRTRETAISIHQKMETLMEMKEQEEKRLDVDDLNALRRDASAKQHRLKKAQTEIQKMRSSVGHFRESKEQREKEWVRFRSILQRSCGVSFQHYMSKQGHTGTLQFNDQAETINILVRISNRGHGDTRDLKSLSGGERSFVTLAFVMALSESISTPFQCIDEYNIYMDAVNMSISTRLLLQFVEVHKDRQFIFLSPLDVSDVKISKDVKILKIRKPDDAQGVINL